MKTGSFTKNGLLHRYLIMDFDNSQNSYGAEYTNENANMKPWVM